jgi:hypothetical protein
LHPVSDPTQTGPAALPPAGPHLQKDLDVAVARFPYMNQEHPAVGSWLARTLLALDRHPRVRGVFEKAYNDTPVTMTRNQAVAEALAAGCRFLVLVDSDMVPDLPGSEKFLPAALDFAIQHADHTGPCVVGAPYCGPPPEECVYVFQWERHNQGRADPSFSLQMIHRDDAARRGGYEEVAALPTGLMLIDLEGVRRLPEGEPWFDYEWADARRTRKASTEDVYFTRNLSLAGVKNYVAWDCWAGHVKQVVVGKPRPLPVDAVRATMAEAILRGHRTDTKRVCWNEGLVAPDPAAADAA